MFIVLQLSWTAWINFDMDDQYLPDETKKIVLNPLGLNLVYLYVELLLWIWALSYLIKLWTNIFFFGWWLSLILLVKVSWTTGNKSTLVKIGTKDTDFLRIFEMGLWCDHVVTIHNTVDIFSFANNIS